MSGHPAATLGERLREVARRDPERVALADPARVPLRYCDLDRALARVAVRLGDCGIGAREVVAWIGRDRLETALALAVLPAACVPLVIDPAIGPAALADLLARARPRALMLGAGAPAHAIDAAAAIGAGLLQPEFRPDAPDAWLDEARWTAGDHAAPVRRCPDPWAYLCTSSGTTGRPKIVPFAHAAALAVAAAVGARLALTADDDSGVAIPIHLGNGMRNGLLLALLHGAGVDLVEEGAPDRLLDEIDRGRVTYVSASFTLFRALLARFDDGRAPRRGRLRFLRIGAGRLEPEEIDRLEAAFGVPAISGLGCVETGLVALQKLPPAHRSRGSVGPPLLADIRIVDDAGDEVAAGAVGEIQVRGLQAIDGYVDDPELDARSFVDGWFRTGDLGRRDADGEYYVTGRLKEVINRGGDKFSPPEIDAAMRSLAGVADAAAFALPHPRLGDEIAAVVVRAPGSGIAVSDVQAAVRARLGARAAPRRIWFVDAVPRNAAGKALRRVLAERHAAEDAAGDLDGAAPQPAMLAAMCAVWAHALGRVDVGADEDFAALGGDAAAARRIAEDVLGAFGVALDPAQVGSPGSTPALAVALVEEARRTRA